MLLPLYPQYSYATTLSSMKEFRRVYGAPKSDLAESVVESFYNHPSYIQALVQRMRQEDTGRGRATDFSTGRPATFLFTRIPSTGWQFVVVQADSPEGD